MKNPALIPAFVALLLSLSFLPGVFAIGISPARITMDFEPGLSKTIEYIVFNNENKVLYVEMYKKGDLSQYITLHQISASLQPGEAKTFTFDLKLPQEISTPGVHDNRIGAIESAPEAQGGLSLIHI